MLVAMHTTQMHASDACLPLIELYKALQAGWTPPAEVSEELYQQAKQGLVPLPLQAFIGFGCSFAGKWFGGYARNSRQDNYAKRAVSGLSSKQSAIQLTKFTHSDYRALNPVNELIYCDPPYVGTTGYNAVGKFDWDEFWSVIRLWSQTNDVFVSSYVAPPDFVPVLTINTKLDCRSHSGREARQECLFEVVEKANARVAGWRRVAA